MLGRFGIWTTTVGFSVLAFDQSAAIALQRLRLTPIQIGTMDLKIALGEVATWVGLIFLSTSFLAPVLLVI
jgi:hypothetical protein